MLTIKDQLTDEESSSIEKIEWCSIDTCLRIEFKNSGAVYDYLGVPLVAVCNLLTADSIGGHFAKNIKGSYEFRKRT